LRLRIKELAHARPRFGYNRIWVLLRREGWPVNKKRVRRLHRLEGLQVRMRVRRRKHMALHRGPAPVPGGPQERWSMDFVHDQLADRRPFRVLTVVDQWSRQSPVLEPALGIRGRDVAAVLDRTIGSGPPPRSITVDHGTEFMSRALEDWAYQRGVQLDFIRPGKPVENAGVVRIHEGLGIDPAHALERPHEVGVLAAEIPGVRGFHMLLGIAQELALVAGQELGHPLGERAATNRRLPLEPEEPVVALQQALPQPHAAHRARRRRHPDQLELVGDLHIAVGWVLPRHRQDLLLNLRRRLIRHPGPPAGLRREPVPAVLLEGILDLVEVAARNPRDVAVPVS
jgi:transposase InsO family protein